MRRARSLPRPTVPILLRFPEASRARPVATPGRPSPPCRAGRERELGDRGRFHRDAVAGRGRHLIPAADHAHRVDEVLMQMIDVLDHPTSSLVPTRR